MKNLTKLIMASVMFAGAAGIASAHDILNATLGTAVGATDYYQVNCFNDGHGNASRLEIQVRSDTTGSNNVSLQVQKGLLARNTTDAAGANTTYSPLVSIAGGNGIYNVLVNKPTTGARQYDILYHCKTSGNAHTGTSISLKQNN